MEEKIELIRMQLYKEVYLMWCKDTPWNIAESKASQAVKAFDEQFKHDKESLSK